jgi:hypothetical protein
MATLFNMKMNPGGQVLRHIRRVLIAFLLLFIPFNISADTVQDQPVSAQSAAESVDSNEQEKARQRELVAEAILHEKLKMQTDVRDLNNQKRAAGEIFGFDIFLGAFLTALWAMISLFIATQFSGAEHNGKKGGAIFHVSASFVPVILLWVAISTGYASWWLTLAVSGLIYWLMGFVFKKIQSSRKFMNFSGEIDFQK